MNPAIATKLADNGVTLQVQRPPRYRYVPFTRAGDILYFSGKTAMSDSVVRYAGRLGAEFGIEEGKAAARLCAVNLLSAIEAGIGLENVRSVLKLTGFVASTPEFFEQATVIDAASALIADVLGEAGEHARSAVGVAVLPGNSAVEIELVVRTVAAE
ncbi:RidA family protein [Cryobacterium tagatosivorans]|uniref:RidA family protein n=1 Tax=Cryobacterium tagatosivorans TaxID=1259199 RepID=A0A4V3I6W5_9MICO|nr:RidA family protein [Cryobacterium tagatosivorans]TFB56740.1 RidA family protein [Cryobacterium tagatosivorans]